MTAVIPVLLFHGEGLWRGTASSQTPPVTFGDSPLRDGALGSMGKFPFLPKAPSLRELASVCETEGVSTKQKAPAITAGAFCFFLWKEVHHEFSEMAYQNLNRFTMRCHRRVKKLPSLTVSVSATVVSTAATVSAVL